MNRRGFTLIELIATIALLAIVAVISYVSISGVIKKSKVSDCNNLISSIKSAAKEYVSDNRYNNINSTSFTIEAKTLVDSNYLSSPIKNPFDNKVTIDSSTIKINITLNSDYSVKTVTIDNAVLNSCGS